MLKIWSPAYSGITSGGGALWEEVRSLRVALEEAPENLGSPFSCFASWQHCDDRYLLCVLT